MVSDLYIHKAEIFIIYLLDSSIDCSYGWQYYNNYCYSVIDFNAIYSHDSTFGGFLKANQFCQNLFPKASLAMPKTKDIFNFITNLSISDNIWVDYFIYYILNNFYVIIFIIKIGAKITNTSVLFNYSWIDGTSFNGSGLG